VGFVVHRVALGQVFSEYFGFPCQSSFHQLLHDQHHLSSGAGTIGQYWLLYQVNSVSIIIIIIIIITTTTTTTTTTITIKNYSE
jgi:hypothetical protein